MQNKQIQALAINQGNLNLDQIVGDNKLYPIIEGYTTIKSRRCLVAVTSDMKTLIRKDQMDEGVVDIPLIIRKIFPTASTWHGVSIPDLTEDKQKALSKLKNLGLDSATQSILPMYLVNKNRLNNPNDLRVFMPRKIIDVKSGSTNDVVTPMLSLIHI